MNDELLPRRAKGAKGREGLLECDAWTSRVLAAAISVHRALGPGLLESAYQEALASEFVCRRIPFEREWPVPVHYKDRLLATHYRMDFLVGGFLVLEIKALEVLAAVHSAQLLTYLRLGGYRIGLLLNFGQPTLKAGIRRFINSA
ncbi:MAG: GxxExxY protein [Gemmatimonadaceae bacterium]